MLLTLIPTATHGRLVNGSATVQPYIVFKQS
jgi:hypothetical protein